MTWTAAGTKEIGQLVLLPISAKQKTNAGYLVFRAHKVVSKATTTTITDQTALKCMIPSALIIMPLPVPKSSSYAATSFA